MKTLATEFQRLRSLQDLSLAELAERAGLRQASPWKIENGKTVKGKTLHDLVIKGLGYSTDSKEYQRIVALWAESHGLIIYQSPHLKAGRRNYKKSIENAIASCTAIEIKAFEKAMTDEPARAAIIALARHYSEL